MKMTKPETHNDIHPNTYKVENEMNLKWAESNPELFVKTFIEFQEDFNNGQWDMSIDMTRKGFAILTATRKDEIFE
jgi:hypothetical protein